MNTIDSFFFFKQNLRANRERGKIQLKQRNQKNLTKIFTWQIQKGLFFCFLLTGCFSRLEDFARAKKFLLRGDCVKAARHFSLLSKLNSKQQAFAFKAAGVCEKKKDYFHSLFFYEALLTEITGEEALKIKRIVAALLFYKIKDYEKALGYYESLLKQARGVKEKFEVGYHISECFYRLQKYSQALFEVNKILPLRTSRKVRQKAVLLKSSILMHLKNFEAAVPFFREQIREYPEKEEFFRQYLAFIFENQANILAAIKELEAIKPSRPFLEKKIKALYERLRQQPGVSL